MTPERLFLDTSYIQAVLNRRDQYHTAATAMLARVRDAKEVWVTEAVLIEVANALSNINREMAGRFIRQCYATANMRVVSVDTALLRRALELYAARKDKTWSLTDCASFVVMQDQELTLAATTDRHFVQAGFQALLVETE